MNVGNLVHGNGLVAEPVPGRPGVPPTRGGPAYRDRYPIVTF